MPSETSVQFVSA